MHWNGDTRISTQLRNCIINPLLLGSHHGSQGRLLIKQAGGTHYREWWADRMAHRTRCGESTIYEIVADMFLGAH